MVKDPVLCTAFNGSAILASGRVSDVALAVKGTLERDPAASILVFAEDDARQVELDVRGSAADVSSRYLAAPRAVGRPKLGVVAREVTLLPRHWDWLAAQPGGASVALRKVVDEARWTHSARDRVRRSQETAYRFISVIAGNAQGFEEASRALFARNAEAFAAEMKSWPADIRAHALRLADDALSAVEVTEV